MINKRPSCITGRRIFRTAPTPRTSNLSQESNYPVMYLSIHNDFINRLQCAYATVNSSVRRHCLSDASSDARTDACTKFQKRETHRYSYQDAPETSSKSSSTRVALESPLMVYLLTCTRDLARPLTRIIASTCARTYMQYEYTCSQ